MSAPSSPVSRLHSLISSLFKKDLNRTILIAIADESGVINPGTNSESIKAYADFLKLVDEAYLFAHSIPNPRPSYLKPIEKIKSIIDSSNPYNPILHTSQAFSTQDLDHLESIVGLIDDQVGAVELTQEKLNFLREKLAEIKEEILNSSIDSRLKEILLEGIRFLIESIEGHMLLGDTGVKLAFDRFVGVISRSKRKYNKEDLFWKFSEAVISLQGPLGFVVDISALPAIVTGAMNALPK
jgi:hypothetical protein